MDEPGDHAAKGAIAGWASRSTRCTARWPNRGRRSRVKLVHSAFFHSLADDAPSNTGTKQLGSKLSERPNAGCLVRRRVSVALHLDKRAECEPVGPE